MKKRLDLIGKNVDVKGINILVSDAHEVTWSNPNHADFHGKQVLCIAGYKNIKRENDQLVGKYTRVDELLVNVKILHS